MMRTRSLFNLWNEIISSKMSWMHNKTPVVDICRYFGHVSHNTMYQNSEKPLDIFLSYRRSNGFQLASWLKEHLQLRGFSVFLDVDLGEINFDRVLQSVRRSKIFILILTPNALDQCINDDECKDWIHREIVTALESQCDIVPLTVNFLWPPPELPNDIRALRRLHGIKWTFDYEDECFRKLVGHLHQLLMQSEESGPLSYRTRPFS